MASVARLLVELTSATLQMRDAAFAGDWTMVASLQKRRAVMVKKIIDAGCPESGDFEAENRLKSIREIERQVFLRVVRNKNVLAESLRCLKSGRKNERTRKRSVDEIYGVGRLQG